MFVSLLRVAFEAACYVLHGRALFTEASATITCEIECGLTLALAGPGLPWYTKGPRVFFENEFPVEVKEVLPAVWGSKHISFHVENKVRTAKLFNLHGVFSQREQESCALEEKLLNDFSTCLSSFEVPLATVFLQKNYLPNQAVTRTVCLTSRKSRTKWSIQAFNLEAQRRQPVD